MYDHLEKTASPEDVVEDAAKGATRHFKPTIPALLALGGLGVVFGPEIMFDDERYTVKEDGTREYLQEAHDKGRRSMTDQFDSFKNAKLKTASMRKHAGTGSAIAQRGALDAIEGLVDRLLYKSKGVEDITEQVENMALVRMVQKQNQGGQQSLPGMLNAGLQQKLRQADLSTPDGIQAFKKSLTDQEMAQLKSSPDFQDNARDIAQRDFDAQMSPDSTAGDIRYQRDQGRELALGRAGALGAGAVAAGIGLDAVSGDPFAPIGTEVERRLFPIEQRVEGREEFAKGFFSQAGKSLGKNLVDTATFGATAGIGAAILSPKMKQNRNMAREIIQKDPVLREATSEEKKMLEKAYDSIVRYSPSLSGDEFAVRNFLRETLMSANGPDYATIGNLAKTEESIRKNTVSGNKGTPFNLPSLS